MRLSDLRRAARACRGCDLYESATQVVFGIELVKSRMMLVGEQPGDVEDRRGEPFVGPAGQVLDRALAAAEIDRSDIYLTNAVKHFRWKATESTSRRLHATPTARHIAACRPWLTAELRAIRPTALVALGSVASQSLFGSGFRLTQHPANSSRGRLLPARTPIRGSGLMSSALPFTRPPSCGPTTGPAARRSTVWFTTSVRSSRLCDGRRSALGFDHLDDALDRDERGGCDDHRKGDACSIPDRPPVEGDHGHAEAVRHRNLG